MILHKHFDINEKGNLTIGGMDAVELAREFGTPAYILDENVIRANCREYLCAARREFGEDALPLYASKALCFTGIYKLAAEEGMGVDCVSGGELYTAAKAGFPAERIYFHGNNKTDSDISQAMDMGVGRFVVDNIEELCAVAAEAERRGIIQGILLRITPGIDPHTHKAVVTGNVDSKFGSAIVTGQAMEIVKLALSKKSLDLVGLHCHIGSQIFDLEPFSDAADIMVRFIADIKRECAYEIRELNLGGGFGVRYTEDDREISYSSAIADIAKIVRGFCEKNGIRMPRVILEPGRSLVAAAGATLYTVGSVKEIPSFRNYVSVDGGMPDNPRYALYQSQYTALIANKASEPRDYRATIAGRCCESGDLLGENMLLQKAERGDILAVLVTGAYNYSMASNYNRLPRPPVIMVRDGKARVAVRRETYEDIVRNDLD
ncbi:MAG: diaminopimelate decarboxylase [Clostridia bacterium]|nr:diaminopimelate decarboxylase [Clostridia bacterium]MBR2613128.1 diaminopimelate decarboxylase [Clostridia bacterium]